MKQLIIITGRSGSGKTLALNALEDIGFYCIDNLPINFLENLQQEFLNRDTRLAVSIDARNISHSPQELSHCIRTLEQSDIPTLIFYIDANVPTLLKRFSETRRRHPLTDSDVTLSEAIEQEVHLLAPLANCANVLLDTSYLMPIELKTLVRERTLDPQHTSPKTLTLTLLSFGYKFGLPPDADYIFDVRCLPNPYWNSELRHLTGHDTLVQQFFETQHTVTQMLADLSEFILHWIPNFEKNHRNYLTIAIGCTGGKHRSVYVVESLAKALGCLKIPLQIRHREHPQPLITTTAIENP